MFFSSVEIFETLGGGEVSSTRGAVSGLFLGCAVLGSLQPSWLGRAPHLGAGVRLSVGVRGGSRCRHPPAITACDSQCGQPQKWCFPQSSVPCYVFLLSVVRACVCVFMFVYLCVCIYVNMERWVFFVIFFNFVRHFVLHSSCTKSAI